MLKKYFKKINKKFFTSLIFILFFTSFTLFVNSTSYAKAVANVSKTSDIDLLARNNMSGDMEVNSNLKNVIEENQMLVDKNRELERELNKLKTKSMEDEETLRRLRKEKEDISDNVKKVRSSNRVYSKEIKKLENEISKIESEKEGYSKKIEKLEKELEINNSSINNIEEMELASKTNEEVVDRESKTIDLLSKIDAFSEEDERLRLDSAKAHYNMGNIYFQRGEYEIAFREYYQAVTLMPNDPDSHYNLAFVSGEYLKDYKTALKHYQMYLYLKPDANDAHVVRQKIMEAKIALRGVVDSPLDETK